MRWLASVHAMLVRGSRSAPVTPSTSPNLASKADLHAKQVSCKTAGCSFREAERGGVFTRLPARGFPSQFCQLNADLMSLAML